MSFLNPSPWSLSRTLTYQTPDYLCTLLKRAVKRTSSLSKDHCIIKSATTTANWYTKGDISQSLAKHQVYNLQYTSIVKCGVKGTPQSKSSRNWKRLKLHSKGTSLSLHSFISVGFTATTREMKFRVCFILTCRLHGLVNRVTIVK